MSAAALRSCPRLPVALPGVRWRGAGGRVAAARASVNGSEAAFAYDPAHDLKREPIMRHAIFLSVAFLALAACDPAQMADKAGRRAAETVVRPVVGTYLSGAQADAATACIVENASAADVQLLARDIAVEAGSATVANVLRIAAQPNTLACFARSGIPPLGGR